jgi:hypothetical protein
MNSNLPETQKALLNAFSKIKAFRELLECSPMNLIPILNPFAQNETERFTKNRIPDFVKKKSFDPNYSMNMKFWNFPTVVYTIYLYKESAIILNSNLN